MAAAKEAFNAAFAAAEAGEHAALRPDALHPVNTDVQAPQIAASYLDDIEDVAAAKAASWLLLMTPLLEVLPPSRLLPLSTSSLSPHPWLPPLLLLPSLPLPP